jgi:hypothetical protein
MTDPSLRGRHRCGPRPGLAAGDARLAKAAAPAAAAMGCLEEPYGRANVRVEHSAAQATDVRYGRLTASAKLPSSSLVVKVQWP